MSATTSPRPLRKDAAERRIAILRAAAEVFAEQGIDAPLEAVADRAGVGRATLYRNFSDRTELALAVLMENLDEMHQRLSREPDDGHGFFRFIDELAEVLVRNAALSGVLRGISSPEVIEPLRRKLTATASGPLKRAQQAGLVRPDILPTDLRIIAALLGAGLHVGDENERRATSLRSREIILGGLRA